MSPAAEHALIALRRHRPTPNASVRFSLTVRWATTVILGSLAPLGLLIAWLGTWRFAPQSGWMVVLIALAGMLALASGWFSRRRHGVSAQWGFAPLSPKEIEEMGAIANADPELGEIVGLWAERCVETGCNLRGRDLMWLRKHARVYLRENELTLPSASPRV